MKKTLAVFAIAAIAALVAVSVATATNTGWYHHTNAQGNGDHCDHSSTANSGGDTVTGPFDTKAACDATTTGGGGGDTGATVGWPSNNGTASGDFTCSPVTITSTDDANGFGAIDFGGSFGTFASLPIFSSEDYTILSGSGAESEPYLIVRFSDDTEVFVYATDVTGPGTRYSDDVNHNTYLTRAQALASYGTKQVSSVTLAVDNGDLSIEVFGVALSNCGGVGATLPPPPNHMFLCYSKFEQDGGQVFTNGQALALLADPNSGFWAPFAALGTTADGPNISGYHLVCNPTGVKPTGQYLYANNDGSAELAPFDALVAGSAGYAVVS